MTASTGDEATEQARALGDPTRNAIFRYIDAASDPVGVAELTDHFGLNHNAIRQHLAKLRDAGLVVEELAPPSGPGRPPLLYRPNPGAAGRWESHSPYEQLSALLIELLQTRDDPRTVGRAAGRRLAKAARGATDRVRLLETLDAAARLRTPHCRTAGRRRRGARPVPVRRNRDGSAGDRLRAPSRVGRGRGRVRTSRCPGARPRRQAGEARRMSPRDRRRLTSALR